MNSRTPLTVLLKLVGTGPISLFELVRFYQTGVILGQLVYENLF